MLCQFLTCSWGGVDSGTSLWREEYQQAIGCMSFLLWYFELTQPSLYLCVSTAAYVRDFVSLLWDHKILNCSLKTLHILNLTSIALVHISNPCSSIASPPHMLSLEVTFVIFLSQWFLGILKCTFFTSKEETAFAFASIGKTGA